MNGWQNDHLLATDDDNCAKKKSYRSQADTDTFGKLANITQSLNVTNADVLKNLQDNTLWEYFCEYAHWAYVESVPLKNTIDEDAYEPCVQAFKQRALIEAQYENSNANNVTTNEMRKTMWQALENWDSKFKNKKSKAPKDSTLLDVDTQELLEKKGKGLSILEGTAGSEDPNYYMFWTNPQFLEQLAISIGDPTVVQSMLPFTPSSTIILELYSDDGIFRATALSVKLYINDQEVPTHLCANQSKCLVADFVTAIKKTLYQDGIATTTELCRS